VKLGILHCGAAVLLVILSSTASGQQPRLLNSKPIERSAKQGMEKSIGELSSGGNAVWVAYSVAAIPGEHQMCCFERASSIQGSCCGGCRLDGHAINVVSEKTGSCQASL
jgi:hypothetical protein